MRGGEGRADRWLAGPAQQHAAACCLLPLRPPLALAPSTHSNSPSLRSGRGLEPRRKRSLKAFWSHTLLSFSSTSTHSCSSSSKQQQQQQQQQGERRKGKKAQEGIDNGGCVGCPISSCLRHIPPPLLCWLLGNAKSNSSPQPQHPPAPPTSPCTHRGQVVPLGPEQHDADVGGGGRLWPPLQALASPIGVDQVVARGEDVSLRVLQGRAAKAWEEGC